MAITRTERLQRKKIAERKRRKRIQEDEVRLAELNKKRRARYQKNKLAKAGKRESNKTKEARRRKWRIAKQKYLAKKKERELAQVKNMVESKRAESSRLSAKKRSEILRVKRYRALKKKNDEVQRLKKSQRKYRQKYYRLLAKTNAVQTGISPRSELKRDLKHSEVSPEVRKKLLFTASVACDVSTSYSSIRSDKKKQEFRGALSMKYTQKYGLLRSKFELCGGIDVRERSRVREDSNRKKMSVVKQRIRQYFEDDSVSTLSPNTSDQIVKKGIKKQKRFLNNSLKYLHQYFCNETNCIVSYSTFCALRPFWVQYRDVDKRDTCLCVKHSNAQLMCQALRKLELVNFNNIDELMENEMCCPGRPVSEACLFRTCNVCADKMIVINSGIEFNGTESANYESWESVKETCSDGIVRKRTIKAKLNSVKYELITKFIDRLLPEYMIHEGTRRHQHQSLKTLKSNLTETDLVIHIDFSENFNCKYAEEIQSIHFGANRAQVTLHTGVLYTGSVVQSFCTISDCLRHDPVAIFGHLKPILEEYLEKITAVHFVSDSPSSQYRNRYMYWLMYKEIIPLFKNLLHFTWNYTEAGHGKSGCDGVGATIKRTCDDFVRQGNDISNFEQFSDHVTNNLKGIKIIPVDPRNAKLEEEVNQALEVRGSMKVHQVVWSKMHESTSLFFNTLSCFVCKDKICQHHYLLQKQYKSEVSDDDSIAEPMNEPIIESVNEPLIDEPIIEPVNEPVDNSVDEPINESEHVLQNSRSESVGNLYNNANFEVNDFVVVRFPLENNKGERRWIGKILSIDEKKESFFMTFLRSKATRLHSGFIYVYPPTLTNKL